jgi:ketosteroid isomerase-like protein
MSRGPREVAESYWQAECARDTEAVLEHFWPDAEFRSPNARYAGRDQIRRYYEESALEFPELSVAISRAVVVGEIGALEWTATLEDRAGRSHSVDGVNVVEVRDGRFLWVHSYFDTALLGT